MFRTKFGIFILCRFDEGTSSLTNQVKYLIKFTEYRFDYCYPLCYGTIMADIHCHS